MSHTKDGPYADGHRLSEAQELSVGLSHVYSDPRIPKGQLLINTMRNKVICHSADDLDWCLLVSRTRRETSEDVLRIVREGLL
jgi:hypothetical protein